METNPNNAEESKTPNDTTQTDQATVGKPEPDGPDSDGAGVDGGDFRG